MFKDSPYKAIFGIAGLIVVIMVAVFLFIRVETVTPSVAPNLVAAQECGVEPTVSIPDDKGIKYTSVRSEDVVVVTAQPESRKYEIEGETQWVFNVAAKDCAKKFTKAPITNSGTYNYADELIEETKRLGEDASRMGKEVNQWAEEKGVWDKFKDMGTGAKESVEDWAQTR